MNEDPQAAVVAFLADPRTHGGQPVERVDTHAAIVFLAGERAYKLKRAVRFPYLDFSTLDRRRLACLAEVRLNRRTAPMLYLDALPVTAEASGELALGGSGTPVDWLVVMRRFDGACLFDRMAEAGRLTPDLMYGLADSIVAFHRAAERCPQADGAAAMRAVVAGNLDELRARTDLFDGGAVAQLADRSAAALDRLAPLMDRRRDAGLVRHAHGDLHLRNVVLLDGRPTLFDAIEFDDALAVVDVLYDLAFLLMDLEHRGLRPLANAVLNRYLEWTGDYGGLALMPLFLSTRAAIRAKVAVAAAVVQPDPGRAAGMREEATAYLALACGALDPPAPRLVAVGGLSGTGKTTLARALAPDLGALPGAVVLRSDVVRKRMFCVPDERRLPPDAYTTAVTETVYATIAARAAEALSVGHAVIADAVYARPGERAALEAVAATRRLPFAGVWLEASAPQRTGRIENRAPDASDADAAIVLRQESYDLGRLAWVRIDAGRPAAMVAADARKCLGIN